MVEIIKELFNEEVRELTALILVGVGTTVGGAAARHSVVQHQPPPPAIVAPAPPAACVPSPLATTSAPHEGRAAKGEKAGAR